MPGRKQSWPSWLSLALLFCATLSSLTFITSRVWGGSAAERVQEGAWQAGEVRQGGQELRGRVHRGVFSDFLSFSHTSFWTPGCCYVFYCSGHGSGAMKLEGKRLTNHAVSAGSRGAARVHREHQQGAQRKDRSARQPPEPAQVWELPSLICIRCGLFTCSGPPSLGYSIHVSLTCTSPLTAPLPTLFRTLWREDQELDKKLQNAREECARAERDLQSTMNKVMCCCLRCAPNSCWPLKAAVRSFARL